MWGGGCGEESCVGRRVRGGGLSCVGRRVWGGLCGEEGEGRRVWRGGLCGEEGEGRGVVMCCTGLIWRTINSCGAYRLGMRHSMSRQLVLYISGSKSPNFSWHWEWSIVKAS